MELLFHRHGLYFHDWFSLLLQPAPLKLVVDIQVYTKYSKT